MACCALHTCMCTSSPILSAFLHIYSPALYMYIPWSCCNLAGAFGLGRMQIASLGDPSCLTQATEQKSHSTLHRVSFADTATATATAALPGPHSKSSQAAASTSAPASARGSSGLLMIRKNALDKKSGCKGRSQGIAKVTQIQQKPLEGAHLS